MLATRDGWVAGSVSGGRRERLAAEGFTPDEIGRIHGPIGLDLGGRAPVETALAILAEMTKVRYGR
jgi:xanthine dehydrogenase accessory factor